MPVDVGEWICKKIKECEHKVTKEYVEEFCLSWLSSQYCFYETGLGIISKLNKNIFMGKTKKTPRDWLRTEEFKLCFWNRETGELVEVDVRVD